MAGDVVELSAEASAADWQARPGADGGGNPDWQLYGSAPESRQPGWTDGRHDLNHPRNLLDELRRAADVVTGIAAKLTEQDIKAPSELPGWTRGHVLAHICGIANAMARQLEYAARGESVELYDGGYEGRTRAIGMAAGHSLDEHRADLDAALERALRAFDSLDAAGWQRAHHLPRGSGVRRRPGALARTRDPRHRPRHRPRPGNVEQAVLRAPVRLPGRPGARGPEASCSAAGPAARGHRQPAAVPR